MTRKSYRRPNCDILSRPIKLKEIKVAIVLTCGRIIYAQAEAFIGEFLLKSEKLTGLRMPIGFYRTGWRTTERRNEMGHWVFDLHEFLQHAEIPEVTLLFNCLNSDLVDEMSSSNFAVKPAEVDNRVSSGHVHYIEKYTEEHPPLLQ